MEEGEGREKEGTNQGEAKMKNLREEGKEEKDGRWEEKARGLERVKERWRKERSDREGKSPYEKEREREMEECK